MIFLYISIILIINSFLCLYRGIYGPTIFDRILAINVFGTKTTIISALIGYYFKVPSLFIDIAIAYAILNFIATIAIARYLERVKNAAVPANSR